MMQDFGAAEASFRLVLMDAPDDKAAAIYLKRSEHYAAHGAPPDWSSVEVLEVK